MDTLLIGIKWQNLQKVRCVVILHQIVVYEFILFDLILKFAVALHYFVLKDFTYTLFYFISMLLIESSCLYTVQVRAVSFALGTFFGGL